MAIHSLVTVKILAVVQLVLFGLSTVVVIAAPLPPESEWSALIIPITWSPFNGHRDRLTVKPEPFPEWNPKATPTHSKLVGTVSEAYLHSTCRGLFCHDTIRGKNHNVESHHDKNRHGQNHHEKKQRGNNHHNKKQCGKNQHGKHCGKNQHHKQRDKNQSDKCHNGMNCHGKNKRQKMKNGNKRKEIIVDNKVIINVNDDRTPSSTQLLRVETTVGAEVSNTSQNAEPSCSLNYCCWNLDIMFLVFLATCLLICFSYNAFVI